MERSRQLVYASLLCYGAHMAAELIDDSVQTIFAGDTPCIRTYIYMIEIWASATASFLQFTLFEGWWSGRWLRLTVRWIEEEWMECIVDSRSFGRMRLLNNGQLMKLHLGWFLDYCPCFAWCDVNVVWIEFEFEFDRTRRSGDVSLLILLDHEVISTWF